MSQTAARAYCTHSNELVPRTAVIYESLRIHPNTGLILEREVPRGGAYIEGYFIPAGTIVGVNAWTIHFDSELYGDSPTEFAPERWLAAPEAKVQEMKRYLFSVSSLILW